jgi:hypothetical protein
MIYFLDIKPVEQSVIKIGFTDRHPSERLKEHRTNMPNNVTLIGACEGDRSYESKLKHQMFEHLMYIPHPMLNSSEWFVPNEELRRFIERVRE